MEKRIVFKKLTVLAIFCCAMSGLLGQENYLSGYVLSWEGDTLRGLINYLNWDKNPYEISFKTREDASKTTYTTNDIRGFGVADERYVRAVVEKEVSPVKVSDLSYDPQFKLVKDTVFLQTMIEGPKSLYYLKGSKELENFYILEDGAFVLLKFKRYLKEAEGISRAVVENKQYVGQLIYYLQDCPDISAKLRNIRYQKIPLERVFSYYYACTGATTSFQKTTELAKVKFGLVAGLSLSTFDFGTSLTYGPFNQLANLDFSHSVNAAGGVFVTILFPRNLRRVSLHNELFFAAYHVNFERTDVLNSSYQSRSRIDLANSYIKLNTLMRYSFPFKRISLFAQAGISNGFATKQVQRESNTVISGTSQVKNEYPLMSDPRSYEQSWVLGLGVALKGYWLELRHERGNGISPFPALRSTSIRTYVLVGYTF
ncbi:MAG: hypothetical protein D6730_20995 [Bacteroidetes bacterium]|nr:MAG: hypothetical protein D6730_20995 [Bacteroidota bacterium]